MSYIVTGGAGFIGGHLVDYLVSRRSDVIAIDDLSGGSYINSKSKFVKLDLRRPANMNTPKGSGIFHFAANPSVRDSMTNPTEHFDRDVKTTVNVMESARKADSEFVVFLSTSAVYGEAKRLPTSESDPVNPISNYAEFKLLAESIICFYSRNYGIKAASLRLANVVGGRSDHGVVYDFVKKLRHSQETLEILGDGSQSKSYMYIDDAIRAIMTAASKMPDSYSMFNVGSTDRISVKEIAQIVAGKMGISPKYIYKDWGRGRGWSGDVKHMQLDASRIRKLGWRPKFSSSQAVSKAVDDALRE